eukprot:495791_1
MATLMNDGFSLEETIATLMNDGFSLEDAIFALNMSNVASAEETYQQSDEEKAELPKKAKSKTKRKYTGLHHQTRKSLEKKLELDANDLTQIDQILKALNSMCCERANLAKKVASNMNCALKQKGYDHMCVKARIFVESVCAYFENDDNSGTDLNRRINDLPRTDLIIKTKSVTKKQIKQIKPYMHRLRIEGNKVAHNSAITISDDEKKQILRVVTMCIRLIGEWFNCTLKMIAVANEINVLQDDVHKHMEILERN